MSSRTNRDRFLSIEPIYSARPGIDQVIVEEKRKKERTDDGEKIRAGTHDARIQNNRVREKNWRTNKNCARCKIRTVSVCNKTLEENGIIQTRGSVVDRVRRPREKNRSIIMAPMANTWYRIKYHGHVYTRGGEGFRLFVVWSRNLRLSSWNTGGIRRSGR